jgi:predicted PurR-regulated permease PerM
VSAGATALDKRAARVERARKEWRRLGLALRSVTPRGVARFVLSAAAIILIARLFFGSTEALFWFFIGAILAYLLLPLINGAERWLPRWAAIIAVYIVAILVVILVIIYVVPPLVNEIGEALKSLPDSKTIHDWVTHIDAYTATLPPDVQKFINDAITAGADTIKANLVDLVHNFAAFILGVVSNLLSFVGFLFGFIVVPFWVFYVLRDQRKGKVALDFLLPSWLRVDFWAIVRIVDDIFGRWIRGQLFLSTVLGVEIFIGLNLLTLLGVEGIKYVLLLAAIAFVTSPIPYIANYLAAIPAVIMGLQTSIQTAAAIMIVYIISQNVQDNVLTPKINGQALSIHPAILMPTIVVLAQFGLFWVILAGPVAAVSRDLFLYIFGRLQDPPHPAGVLPRNLGSVEEVPTARSPETGGPGPPPVAARALDAVPGEHGESISL